LIIESRNRLQLVEASSDDIIVSLSACTLPPSYPNKLKQVAVSKQVNFSLATIIVDLNTSRVRLKPPSNFHAGRSYGFN
jgi:hypothetical protein